MTLMYNSKSQGIATPVAIGLGLLAVAVMAGGFFIYQQTTAPDQMMIKNDDAMIEKTDDTTMDDEAMMADDKAIENSDTMMEKIDEVMMPDDDAMTKNDAIKNEESMKQSSAGVYTAYTAETFAANQDKTRVLFFHASWCPSCKVANAELSANASSLPQNVVVFKTDYDTNGDLKKKYGVTYQHTFVQVDAAGNMLAKWNGGGVAEIAANIK